MELSWFIHVHITYCDELREILSSSVFYFERVATYTGKRE